METTNDKELFKANTSVKEGRYRCSECDHIALIFRDGDDLPICPQCGCFYWYKIEE